MQDQMACFLHAAYEDAIGRDARLAIWTLPDRRTRWFHVIDTAVTVGHELAANRDVYFGVGLYRRGIKTGRGKSSDVVAITCVWADVDYGPNHKKTNMAPNRESAEKILAGVRLTPSIVVSSGHGLHAYWLLKEALRAEDGAATIARRWGATLQASGQALGYAVDSVGDLARVLRLPGTINHKPPEAPVEIIESDVSRRYDVSDIDEWAVPLPETHADSLDKIDDVVVDSAATVPAEKILLMMENDPRFVKTWQRDRSDLQDDSPSGYELAIAHAGHDAGLSNQEIINLVIQWGRKHGLDRIAKLRRPIYKKSLLQKASRKFHGNWEKLRTTHIEGTCVKNDKCKSKAGLTISLTERCEILQMLREVLGVDVTRWVQYGRESAIYSLFVGDVSDEIEVVMSGVCNVTSQKRFRDAIYEATGKLAPNVKSAVWQRVCQALGRIRVVVDARESSTCGEVAEWVESYLATGVAAIEDAGTESAIIADGRPFVRDGVRYITSRGLAQYVRISQGERIAARLLCKTLESLGWQRKVLHCQLRDNPSLIRDNPHEPLRSTRSYYFKAYSVA